MALKVTRSTSLGSAFFLHLSYVRYYWLILALAAAAYEIWKIETPKQFPPAQQLAYLPNPAPPVKPSMD